VRKAIFWLHLIAGLIAGVVILVMSLSGVLLMYQRQITEWADASRIQEPPAAERLSLEALLRSVTDKEGAPPNSITIPSNPNRAALGAFPGDRFLVIDPYTGNVMHEGSKKARSSFKLLIEWHRYLGRSGDSRPIGKAITGACNLAFLFLVVSGFYLWWPRTWNRRVLAFDWKARGKARDWNWHNVIGFWSAIPLFLLVFTAIFFSYPTATTWLYKIAGETPPPYGGPGQRPQPNAPAKGAPDFRGIDQAWNRAVEQMPGWRTINVRLPASTNAPFNFAIDRGTGGRPDLKGQFTISRTGEIEKAETYGGYSPARQARFWIRWIHTGEAGGFLGQTIAGAASLGGVFLVWTGIALAVRRFLARRAA